MTGPLPVRQQPDPITRAALIATVAAVATVLIPLISMVIALVAIVLSATALVRSRRRGLPNPVALRCLVGALALVAFVVIGSAIYAAAN